MSSSKDHICYHIQSSPELKEILLAFLEQLPFNAFEETTSGWRAYPDVDVSTEEINGELLALKDQFEFSFKTEIIKGQNWNAVWEAGFQPVVVDEYCGIRANFHPPFEKIRHEIVIQPKMAFGTGHHATTYMMIKMMQDLPLEGKNVFDYGCGTGILAILADKENAAQIDAVDIEEESYTNTIENAAINQATKIEPFLGTLEDVPPKKYDIILANINRNVILNSLDALYSRLMPASYLLVSGILHQDENKVIEKAFSAGFKHLETIHRGDWSCLKFIS
ncbi:MAG: 50S ribosomal protein L11 methyltransferase [Bacteroidetes bacterium]|nr:MAG: 50S ribosomal protein L11 methyltransferase [Bacteroidota bacterium]